MDKGRFQQVLSSSGGYGPHNHHGKSSFFILQTYKIQHDEKWNKCRWL